jgi:hypothetical protein
MWGKKEPSYTAGGDINWYNHHGKQYKGSSKKKKKKIKIELPHDLAIPLLGIYPKESKSGHKKGSCTPMLLQHYSQ